MPLIAYQALEFLGTRIDRLVVVLGARADTIQSALASALAARGGSDFRDRLKVVINRDWKEGKCGSIRTGVRELSSDVRDIVLHSVDQPTTAEVLESLFGFHRAATSHATLPFRDGRKGHPVCMRSTERAALANLAEEELGLRGLIRSLDERGLVHLAPMAAPCTRWDINRPEDLASLK